MVRKVLCLLTNAAKVGLSFSHSIRAVNRTQLNQVIARTLTTETQIPSTVASNSQNILSSTGGTLVKRLNYDADVKEALSGSFAFTEDEIERRINKYPKLLNQYRISSIFYLKDLGLRKDVLLAVPWLATIPQGEINQRRSVIAKFYPDMSDINTCAPLLRYDTEKLEKFVSEWQLSDDPSRSKFHYLADFFEVSLEEMVAQVEVKKFLVVSSLEKMKKILNVLTEAGVLKEDIYQDLWILRHNYYTLKTRLSVATEAGVRVIKPRFLRTTSDVFPMFIKKHADIATVMEDHVTLASYLCQRLKCDPCDIQFMCAKWPMVRSLNALKAKEMIDYLFAQGFTANHILITPRILCHKLSTISQRTEELKKLGYKFGTLSILCRTPVVYNRLLDGIKRDLALKNENKL